MFRLEERGGKRGRKREREGEREKERGLEFEMLLMILYTCHHWTHFLFACKVSCALSRLRLAVRLNTPSLPNSGMNEDFTIKLAAWFHVGKCDLH